MISLASSHALTDSRVPTGFGGRFYGVYAAVVTDVADPDGQGRVRVRLPWAPDADGQSYEAWARLATLMAGPDRGSWFVPDPDDEVLVAFEAGDPRRPYVVGSLWNGQDAPPASMDGAGDNNLKVLRSRNGVQITLDDTDGQETLTLETPGGQSVTLSDGPGAIELVDSNGNSVQLGTAGITIQASAKVTVSAGTIELSAGSVQVTSGSSTFSGTVTTPTLSSGTVLSGTYTPGAGNIL